MKASKILSLVLAGVMAASMLSGCTKEIIEYQIYTETVSGGSTVSGGNTGAGGSGGSGTAGNTITAQEAFNRLRALLEKHGIELRLEAGTTYVRDDYWAFEKKDEYLTVKVDRLKEWAENLTPTVLDFYVMQEIADRKDQVTVSAFLTDWAELANMLYEAFLLFEDQDWKNFTDDDITFLRCVGDIVKDPVSGKYYTRVALKIYS